MCGFRNIGIRCTLRKPRSHIYSEEMLCVLIKAWMRDVSFVWAETNSRTFCSKSIWERNESVLKRKERNETVWLTQTRGICCNVPRESPRFFFSLFNPIGKQRLLSKLYPRKNHIENQHADSKRRMRRMINAIKRSNNYIWHLYCTSYDIPYIRTINFFPNIIDVDSAYHFSFYFLSSWANDAVFGRF